MSMNIRQAARWAERKDILYRVGYDGQPEYLYAVYDTGNHLVECVGEYDKCRDYLKSLCGPVCSSRYAQTGDGRYLRAVSLDEVCEEMDESEGEARCIPEAGEMREWA